MLKPFTLGTRNASGECNLMVYFTTILRCEEFAVYPFQILSCSSNASYCCFLYLFHQSSVPSKLCHNPD
jgi:hypothetical protein